jgi:hypothetical protein
MVVPAEKSDGYRKHKANEFSASSRVNNNSPLPGTGQVGGVAVGAVVIVGNSESTVVSTISAMEEGLGVASVAGVLIRLKLIEQAAVKMSVRVRRKTKVFLRELMVTSCLYNQSYDIKSKSLHYVSRNYQSVLKESAPALRLEPIVKNKLWRESR